MIPYTLFRQRYRILEKLGTGGFGTVYKARDEKQIDKYVAIKQINLAGLSAQKQIEVTDSFNREVSLLSTLRHHSLPRIYDHFSDSEHWYVIMDYIEGETLEQHLQRVREGRLPVVKVLKIGLQLCSVLNHLHQQKPPIIFRDVKPDNIMFTPAEFVYLIDFGIARRYRRGQAKDTEPLGVPGYAAPEQYGRAQTTPQTDIYGLGATLQTLLTGKDPIELKIKGWTADSSVPQRLRELLDQMMEREAALRPQNMQLVYQRLNSMLNGQGAAGPHYPARSIPVPVAPSRFNRSIPAAPPIVTPSATVPSSPTSSPPQNTRRNSWYTGGIIALVVGLAALLCYAGIAAPPFLSWLVPVAQGLAAFGVLLAALVAVAIVSFVSIAGIDLLSELFLFKPRNRKRQKAKQQGLQMRQHP